MVKDGGKEAERVEELGKEVKKEMKSVVFYVWEWIKWDSPWK